MQGLVYIFIALAGLAIGAAAYFGFTFSPIEAGLTALVFGACAIVLLERHLRQRAEDRLEKGIEDLSRLLGTDAQAGQLLSQRVNALLAIDAGKRLEGIEADVSVLGTVIRQVAEALHELEENKAPAEIAKPEEPAPSWLSVVDKEPEPVIPLEMVKQALEDNRLIYHIQPIVTLPQRRPHGYDLVPRLMMEDGELADKADFMPRRDGEVVIRHIEGMAVNEAVVIVRRARTGGTPISIYVPLSRPTLADIPAMDLILVALDANRAVSEHIIFAISGDDWQSMAPRERAAAQAIIKKGASFSLVNVKSLRLDFAELAGLGVGSIRVDANRFTNEPEEFTDFHSSDIASYIKRYGIDLIASNIRDERQIISVLEDGVALAQGSYIAGPGPIRPDLLASQPMPISAQR